jgi:hypothetical protein
MVPHGTVMTLHGERPHTVLAHVGEVHRLDRVGEAGLGHRDKMPLPLWEGRDDGDPGPERCNTAGPGVAPANETERATDPERSHAFIETS